MQSLGARFVELPLEAKDAQDARGYASAQDEALLQPPARAAGSVIAETTWSSPPRLFPAKSPRSWSPREMVAGMAPGSVIVDLAAERGGNCELTQIGEKFVSTVVTIIGWVNVASGVAFTTPARCTREI